MSRNAAGPRLAGAILLALALGAFAQDPTYDWLRAAQESLDAAVRHFSGGEYELAYELVPRDEFEGNVKQLAQGLAALDLDGLSEWYPRGVALLHRLAANPGTQPIADWLRQRLDYADMARRAVEAAPAPKPEPGRKPVVSPAARTKRDSICADADAWKKMLKDRPTPSGAEALAPRLKPVFRSEGVPEALVWLAEVESSFNPKARSPVGAAGLFQFMPRTAEGLGLSLKPVDERLDPDKSARAAAQYLRHLHGRFDTWPLALAAYNGGEGRVARLLKKHKADSFEAISGRLPAETRMYVPKVLATIQRREGIDPAALAPPGG